ncbi:HNH endonuclease [Bradyrhizobium japonicum]|uniref:HNH endonuclease n=1 Tax=Bradyrhizobium japonicum TaxID=375 RepID=UPI001BA8C3C7|nr:HNH endonuclease signature motif containing protein [Bradyrhizobium japonicum]MBR0749968.1 HNH endonuclease [Bradyrhizobium japonicum]
MQTRTELLRAIQKLPAQTPLFPRSQKENWIAWLLGYDEFPRKNPDRDAQVVYNALNNANYVIWLGAAAGVEPRLVKRAVQRVAQQKKRETQAAAARAVLPWALVARHLQETSAQKHFVAYHNSEELGPYFENAADRRAKHGSFFTAKLFRAERLTGQYLWVFEGSGSPRRYHLVSHGVISSAKKEVRPSWYRKPGRRFGTRLRFVVNMTADPIEVTAMASFKKLLRQQQSFRNGLNSTSDQKFIAAMRSLGDEPDDDVSADISRIRSDPTVRSETTRKALIDARLGTGDFRGALARRWRNQCAVTGCAISEVLRASHIKPWAESSNKERLNPANGLLLVAHIDALFDRGLISFTDAGTMLLSASLGPKDRALFRLPARLRSDLSSLEKRFLNHHRRTRFRE